MAKSEAKYRLKGLTRLHIFCINIIAKITMRTELINATKPIASLMPLTHNIIQVFVHCGCTVLHRWKIITKKYNSGGTQHKSKT